MSTIHLNRNDVILARIDRNDKWETVVFDHYDTSYVSQIACVDTRGDVWKEWAPLKGNEKLQDTSLPIDGWKRGDMCVYKDLDGIDKIGFYAGSNVDGTISISTMPLKIVPDEDKTFNLLKEDVHRPEELWPWWDVELYADSYDPNWGSRVVPI